METETIAYHKVWWNHGDSPIFISRSIKANPLSQGTMENKMIIMPGDGIDVTCLDLRPWKIDPDQESKKEK